MHQLKFTVKYIQLRLATQTMYIIISRICFTVFQVLTLPDLQYYCTYKNLLLKMLQKDPSSRATLAELKRDQWLNQGFAVSLDS